MNKKQKLIILLIAFMLVIVGSGLTYAYFTSFNTSEKASTIYAKGGTMKIVYANGSGNITIENIYPKEEAWVNKIFTVTGNNSTELDMEYRIYLKTSNNDFNAGDLTYSIGGTSTNVGDKIVEKANQPLAKTGELLLGKGIFKSKTAIHSYNLRIFYKETNEDQNNGQNKSFTGYVRIDNGSSLEYDTPVFRHNSLYSNDEPAFNGPITKNKVKTITFTNSSEVPANAIASWDAGEKQDGTIIAYLLNKDANGLYDLYIGQDGKVVLGKNASYLFSGFNKVATLDVSSIDTSYVTDMSHMFYNSYATSINGLENFNTSNVTDMYWMFSRCDATTLDLSGFDTSKVTNMSYMFYESKATMLDLSSFDTSNVTNMSYMFNDSSATSIKGLDGFDTSNVTDMSSMFRVSKAATLDLSSFDTSKVTNMSWMFSDSYATEIKGLNNFDTLKVTNMDYMFNDSSATTIKGLDGFNTSNVTNMSSMFHVSKAATLDLSSFDTSKVTNMYNMFSHSQATTLDLSSFDTSKVTDMSWMFVNSKATSLDLSSFDTMKVTNMDCMFLWSKATIGYARTQADADKLNATSNKPSGLTFTVKS